MVDDKPRIGAAVFQPLKHEDILIDNEVIIYCERKHWASMIQPSFETASLLFATTILATGSNPGGLISMLVMLFSVINMVILVRRKTYKDFIKYGIILALLILVFQIDLLSIIIMTIFFSAIKFIARFALWAFYERLYITNRRVLASGGIVGSKISTMPLGKFTDITITRNITGELFDYATVDVESAGDDQDLSTVYFLNKPDEFYGKLISLSTKEEKYEPPATKVHN